MAVAMLGGFLIALFYDIYWLLVAHKRRPRWLRAVQDMLFWLAAFCAVTALWLYATGGVMRLAVYLWLGLGMLLCRVGLSPRLRRLRRRAPSPPTAPPTVSPDEPGLRPHTPQAEIHTESAVRSLPQRLLAGPPAAMLGMGLGFWRGLFWLQGQGKRGGAWLGAHLPKRPRAADEDADAAEPDAPEALEPNALEPNALEPNALELDVPQPKTAPPPPKRLRKPRSKRRRH